MQCVRVFGTLQCLRGSLAPHLGELLGGEDRIDPTLFESCGDSLIVNLGAEEWEDVSACSGSFFLSLSLGSLTESDRPKELG